MAFTVAVDGPAAAGKGTVARAVAEHFGLAHLDTGALYRAVGLKVLEGADPVDAARSLTPADLERSDLRTPEAADAASKVATIPEVRAALRDFQRAFARRAGGAVLDGRDIGTVICPDAEVKLFIIASDEVRAERRWKELRERGINVTLADVLAELRERDRRDTTRTDSPLRPAEDAIIIDTTHLTIDEAIARAVAEVEKRLPPEMRKQGKAQ
ncbi:cytidylate kinase [Meinhardsimonia xiamenensis]|jgi:cytidylate kinase|uniref:Cytidylate kinase n=1 Tax=Meinhardsimonia xiamenensis TaxID=990712 RepID=A0A1G9CEQ1_9RHOB|nr:(d)CMP kinase [Meinhardsimonia xiamenensis]PRX38389.1 cytidylate kinase [Meinhardsimonia xiamenensis]SDK50056.1 cytidylate kinase [Meinhardsimonia xiamenensis]